MIGFDEVTGFEWDKGNITKNPSKHQIHNHQSEEIFLDENLLTIEDIKHSQKENRQIAIGKTFDKTLLFIIFTIRNKKIRIMSIKKIPKFKNEKQEREFWQKHDSTEYIDYSKAQKAKFPNLQLTSRPITIRLNVELIDRIKIKANKLDMPYQTYIKQMIYSSL